MTVTAASLGLSSRQLGYAVGIVTAVKKRGWGIKAAYIALCTAIAESGLQMYANGNNWASMRLPHDNVGWDHGSVGLFQQQVGGAVNSTANWGTTAELMNAEISCGRFLNVLTNQNWQGEDEWVTAQNVQRSAYDGFPRAANNWNSRYGGNYYSTLPRARQIVNAVWGARVTSSPAPAARRKHSDRRYTVRPGDTLTVICRRYREAWITPAYVRGLNPTRVKDVNRISAGWVLWIDTSTGKAKAAGPAKPTLPSADSRLPTPSSTRSKPVTGAHPDVTVRRGDSLSGIARRYPEAAITAASIAKANFDRYPTLRSNPNVIQAGWTLRIR